MIETITLQQTTVTTNSYRMLKIPHHFGTGRLFIKNVLPTGLIIRRKMHFCESVSNWVNSIMEKGWTDFRALNV